ncbi:Fic/DOC family protein [Arcticibacter tournemirensis]|uniref:Fic family protein n=1 Tax=Arcticibacter tournemirensis TaxID=699437 RepID=A0A5M9HN64_9SPHI|nr:Fic family protein [Arcticibacter tournemirensis]KAA8486828.1 Fic family protein [Arcticibacter tournemirensis]TQM49376.1 Fic/DOC family protein [Arcticibacter tournemirensis]
MNTALIDRYKSLGIEDVIDHEKFNHISIVHHSTVLEGSTLTEVETEVLLNEGLTPKGKPLLHTLMVKDHYTALRFVLNEAKKRRPVSEEFIREIGAAVLKNTGSVYHTVLGNVDSSKGEYRKGNVRAGDTYFPNYDEVPSLVQELVLALGRKMSTEISLDEKINLSFDAHFNLVSIHPFYDGNGRSSRLLMNYIQAYYGLPLAIVRQESKVDYIQALLDARAGNNINIFRKFMSDEYEAMLSLEIEKFENMNRHQKGKGFGFTLLF